MQRDLSHGELCDLNGAPWRKMSGGDPLLHGLGANAEPPGELRLGAEIVYEIIDAEDS